MKRKESVISVLFLSLIFVLITAGCSSPADTTPANTQQPASTMVLPDAADVSTRVSEAHSQATIVTIHGGSNTSIIGEWKGSLTISGSSLDTNVYFKTDGDELTASLDIPVQSLFGYDLANVSYDGEIIHFEAFEEAGRKAVWEGKMTEDGKISGTFSQLVYTGTFELTRSDLLDTEQAELPYTEEEVSIKNGDITLAGTLSIPDGKGPFPVLILISGSGAQNRDEEIYGFKIFAVIADHLTRNDIAVLRYDDRGVGKSTGSIDASNSSDFAQDVLAWVDYLKIREEIDPNNIGLMGHSEGGIIAPMAAAQSNDIAYIVLMAGPAMTGEDIIYKQVELIARSQGLSEEKINATLALQHRIFNGLIRGDDWEGAKAEIHQQIADQINALSDIQKAALGDIDQYTETVYQQQIDSLETIWYRYFLEYDPIPALENITIPVLAFFGGKDIQVPADPNAELMEAALRKAGNTDATIITYPNANHLFQEAETGTLNEYSTLGQKFLPGFLDDLTNWLKTEQK